MTADEALRLIDEYDKACEDCAKRPGSKAAGARYMRAFNRLVAHLCATELKP